MGVESSQELQLKGNKRYGKRQPDGMVLQLVSSMHQATKQVAMAAEMDINNS